MRPAFSGSPPHPKLDTNSVSKSPPWWFERAHVERLVQHARPLLLVDECVINRLAAAGVHHAVAKLESSLGSDSFRCRCLRRPGQRLRPTERGTKANIANQEFPIVSRRPPAVFVLHSVSEKFFMVSSLLQEKCVKIRAVNRGMAQRACRIFLALVMERGNRRRTRILGERVALQAQQVDLGALQQARIGRTMRRVAGDAAFGLDRLVLERERTRLVGVALEADFILRRRRPQLLGQKSAVLVVAVGALHQSLVDAMPERRAKIPV